MDQLGNKQPAHGCIQSWLFPAESSKIQTIYGRLWCEEAFVEVKAFNLIVQCRTQTTYSYTMDYSSVPLSDWTLARF